MKGIILAGGSGTRLHPSTLSISKQLMPVYDKPMIYYPLSTLMLAGIREILIISTPQHLHLFKELLGDGKRFGIELTYTVQEKPEGLAQAFILGEDFIGNDSVCLILGDNIFYGHGFQEKLVNASKLKDGGLVFGYYVKDPKRYGVATLDENMNVLDIEEKPEEPKSNYAITGLYFFDNTVVQKAKSLSPSKRGELEITDLNKLYLAENKLKGTIMGRGMAWLDTGTHESLLEAANFVSIVEKRQGQKICCPEEVAFRKGYITKDDILTIARDSAEKNEYYRYLMSLVS